MTLEEWRAECPLRKWIDKNGHGSIMKLAEVLGVHRTTIDNWTRGRIPRLRCLKQLEAATGVAVSSWTRWLLKKPTEGDDAE